MLFAASQHAICNIQLAKTGKATAWRAIINISSAVLRTSYLSPGTLFTNSQVRCSSCHPIAHSAKNRMSYV
jgi:hypothetical protein